MLNRNIILILLILFIIYINIIHSFFILPKKIYNNYKKNSFLLKNSSKFQSNIKELEKKYQLSYYHKKNLLLSSSKGILKTIFPIEILLKDQIEKIIYNALLKFLYKLNINQYHTIIDNNNNYYSLNYNNINNNIKHLHNDLDLDQNKNILILKNSNFLTLNNFLLNNIIHNNNYNNIDIIYNDIKYIELENIFYNELLNEINTNSNQLNLIISSNVKNFLINYLEDGNDLILLSTFFNKDIVQKLIIESELNLLLNQYQINISRLITRESLLNKKYFTSSSSTFSSSTSLYTSQSTSSNFYQEKNIREKIINPYHSRDYYGNLLLTCCKEFEAAPSSVTFLTSCNELSIMAKQFSMCLIGIGG